MGDSLTLVGGVLYAAHIVAVAKITKKKDPVLVTIVQFGYTAIFAWIAVFSTKQSSITTLFNTEIIFSILYLALFCTAVALLLQTIGQKNTPPAQASIILCLEAVFGVFFSVLFYHEKVTIQLLLGFVLILISVVISETKLSFLQQMRVNVKVRTEE
jgi:drug/metabolite transporter (DMT)-like permease